MDKTDILVAEVMTKRPVSVSTGQSVNSAAKMMKKYHVSSVLVMDKKDLIGILTTDDIVYKLLALEKQVKDVLVDDIMTTQVMTITSMVSLQEAMDLLSEHNIRQLPIINNGVLVGLVTLKDILRYEPTLVDVMVENIRFEEQQRQEQIRKYSESTIDDSLFE